MSQFELPVAEILCINNKVRGNIKTSAIRGLLYVCS